MNLFNTNTRSAVRSSARVSRQMMIEGESLDSRLLLNASALPAVHVQAFHNAPSHSIGATAHVIKISAHTPIETRHIDAVSWAIDELTRGAAPSQGTASGTGTFAAMDTPATPTPPPATPPATPPASTTGGGVSDLLGSASW